MNNGCDPRFELSFTAVTTLPKAVLLDMDGTLVDTEPLWWQAADETATRLGYVLESSSTADVVGRPVSHTAGYLACVTGTAQPVEELAGELEARFLVLVRNHTTVLPGARSLLALLQESRIPAALVSASPRSVVDVVLDVLGRRLFATSVAAGETPRTKPFPDPYLAAARALGLAAIDCLAVEDSPTGIASAEAAGVPVIVVPSPTTAEDGPGRTRVRSLEEADLALLAKACRAGSKT